MWWASQKRSGVKSQGAFRTFSSAVFAVIPRPLWTCLNSQCLEVGEAVKQRGSFGCHNLRLLPDAWLLSVFGDRDWRHIMAEALLSVSLHCHKLSNTFPSQPSPQKMRKSMKYSEIAKRIAVAQQLPMLSDFVWLIVLFIVLLLWIS